VLRVFVLPRAAFHDVDLLHELVVVVGAAADGSGAEAARVCPVTKADRGASSRRGVGAERVPMLQPDTVGLLFAAAGSSSVLPGVSAGAASFAAAEA
jgi:hypothetical protein